MDGTESPSDQVTRQAEMELQRFWRLPAGGDLSDHGLLISLEQDNGEVLIGYRRLHEDCPDPLDWDPQFKP